MHLICDIDVIDFSNFVYFEVNDYFSHFQIPFLDYSRCGLLTSDYDKMFTNHTNDYNNLQILFSPFQVSTANPFYIIQRVCW